MKKYMAAILVFLFLLPLSAFAESFFGEAEAAVLAAYPGGKIEAQEARADRGVFSVLQGAGRVLVIAEEQDGQPVLTIQNENALPDLELVPEGALSVLLDTGAGDALFLSWNLPDAHFTLHAEREAPGRWADVDLLVQNTPQPDGKSLEQLIFVQHGLLVSEEEGYDGNGNPLEPDTRRIMRLPVTEAFAKRMKLEAFSLPEFLESCYDSFSGKQWLKHQDGLNFPLEAGETLLDMDAQNGTTVFLVEEPDKTRTIRIWDWDGFEHREQRSIPFGPALSLDTFHTGDGDVFAYWDDLYMSFVRGGDGRYELRSILDVEDTETGLLELGENSICGESSFYGKNDGYLYGRREPVDLLTCNFDALPRTFGEAAAQLDSSAFALVHNPNPKDRLHLRVKPQKGAKSLGKFYNRTPVEILEDDGGDWVHVRVGSTLEGYMMRKFLTFSEAEKAQVSCAFEVLLPGGPMVPEAPVYGVPDAHTEPVGLWKDTGETFVIGVYEDDWLVVLLPDGRTGYVLRADSWAGNG